MRSFKKVALLSVATLFTLALVACGSSSSTSSPDYKLKDVSFPLKDKVSLKIVTSSSTLAPEDPNNKLIYKRLEKDTNVHIDWTNYTNDYAEKRNLDISSGDLPDVFWNAAASDVDLMSWAEDGVIVPVEDLIKDYMPNLQKVLDENSEYKSMVTAPDGHIYSLPWIEELGAGKKSIHSVNDMAFINQEWLDKLGLKMPTTTDELITVLKAFKEKDPNGNGKADEIPISFINNGGNEDFKLLFGAFGIGDNDDHLVVGNDGKVDFTADNEDYKEGVQFMRKLYEAGLIDTEAFEQDWNTYISKGSQNVYGVYFTWDKANVTGANDSYSLLPVLAGPDGKKNVTRTNNLGFSRDRVVITSANKNLELTAKWLDKMYEPLQSVQNNWGTYGDKKQQNIFEFDKASNMLKHLPLDGTAPGELRQKTEVGGGLAILDEYYGTVTTMPDDAAYRLDWLKETYVPYMGNDNIYPRVFMEEKDLKRIEQINADLMDYVNRKRSEWIVNGGVENEWADYLKELQRFNLDEWVQIKQSYYDKYLETENK
ncbi:ABC transporter substrate-binding protein [Streptococcus sp. 20-1249]|uniref:ABC transporter substrate-binding protein n=1 Tax=Streptococcus hepaticus TaxID=3349163 RepID=UPI003748ABFE